MGCQGWLSRQTNAASLGMGPIWLPVSLLGKRWARNLVQKRIMTLDLVQGRLVGRFLRGGGDHLVLEDSRNGRS